MTPPGGCFGTIFSYFLKCLRTIDHFWENLEREVMFQIWEDNVMSIVETDLASDVALIS